MEFALSISKNKPEKLTGNQKHDFHFLSENHFFQESQRGDWIIWIGDYVLPDDRSIETFLSDQLNNADQKNILKTGGYFYFIRYINETKELQVGTGFLNILPIFYFEDEENTWVASKPKLITENIEKEFSPNRKFILEKLLFNYPFENDTIFQNIKMLSGNHFLMIDHAGVKEIRHTDILDWVVPDPLPVRQATGYMVDLLNETFDTYFPDEEFYLSFTGGFDGRTILSRALYNHLEPATYAFGTQNSSDIVIPSAQAKELGIRFFPFYLDDEKYLKKSKEYGFELVEITGGMSNFARAHYVYAAKQISGSHKYIVTGNFGSELFRAFHNTGVMVTPFLFNLFDSENVEQFLETYTYPELDYLNRANFNEELLSLKEQIISSDIFTKKGFSKNQLFYKYVFEEIFRKYFGAELIMQNRYLYNRTPYLDYTLVKEILKTKLAGVYSDFYENNPAKRLKGQMLYALCIQSNSKELFNMKTGKGYPPKNIITPTGKLYLLLNLINKKLRKKKSPYDEFGVLKAFELNKDGYLKQEFEKEYFNENRIKEEIPGKKNDLNNLINTISLNWYIQQHVE